MEKNKFDENEEKVKENFKLMDKCKKILEEMVKVEKMEEKILKNKGGI